MLSGGKIGFEFSTENEGAAKCAKRLFFSAFSVELGEGKEKSDALNKRQRFTFLYAGERAAHILRELGILSQGGVELGVPAELFKSDGAKKSFLRGVFVGAGSLTVPKRKEEGESSTGYHLGFALSNEDFARGGGDCRDAGRTGEQKYGEGEGARPPVRKAAAQHRKRARDVLLGNEPRERRVGDAPVVHARGREQHAQPPAAGGEDAPDGYAEVRCAD